MDFWHPSVRPNGSIWLVKIDPFDRRAPGIHLHSLLIGHIGPCHLIVCLISVFVFKLNLEHSLEHRTINQNCELFEYIRGVMATVAFPIISRIYSTRPPLLIYIRRTESGNSKTSPDVVTNGLATLSSCMNHRK